MVASFIALFGLMYWQAPEGQSQIGAVQTEQASEWQKLRQQIQTHQQHFASPAPFRRQDAHRHVERASIPQVTESYAANAMRPVQEAADAATDQRPPSPAIVASAPKRLTPKRTASSDTRTHPKRIVRITTYEGGRAVGVRSFELNVASPGGPAHRRYYVACPGGKCQPLTASMFGPGGRFN